MLKNDVKKKLNNNFNIIQFFFKIKPKFAQKKKRVMFLY